MRRAASVLLSVFASVLAAAGPAAADPTEAQLSAIKSNCRSDFMSNCWGVPRGGKEAFQCLKQHMAKLSPACAQAVKAVSPPAPAPAPKQTESAPPAPAAAPPPAGETKAAVPAAEPAPAEAKGAPAPEPAPKAAAPKTAAPGTAASKPEPALPKPAAPKSAAPVPNPAEPESAAPAPETAAPAIIGFIPPRKKLMVQRHCRRDLETYCAGVEFGDGRLLRCLLQNKDSLTADCQGALAKLAR
jgi:hypothetical protein